MEQEENVSLLFSFYFGDAAAAAQRGASGRLKKWSRAFEKWMDERRRDYQKDTVKQSVMAWRRLVRQCGKMPWQMRREDIEQYLAWMKEEGLAKSTINDAIGIIANFFQWCDEQQMDTACEKGFNPAKEVGRIQRMRFEGTSMWSREEMKALLELTRRDDSGLGKREMAFFQTRIHTGVPLKRILGLTWGQCGEEASGAWVKWRPEGERSRLPEQVWQAIREYLVKSGRMEAMLAEKYIFTPLAEPGRTENGVRAEDWMEDRQVSVTAVLTSLKIYGRALGISEEKLDLMALRRSAIRLKMDEGTSLEGMKTFMDSQDQLKIVKYRLSKLPALPTSNTEWEGVSGREVEVPSREAKPFKIGENITHGFYRQKIDPQAVRAVMEQNIRGLDEEIACLRQLMDGLLERDVHATQLAEVYTRAARRLAELIAAAGKLKAGQEDPRVEQYLKELDEAMLRSNFPPCSQELRQAALGLDPHDAASGQMLAEVIATTRLLLRNAHRRATQQEIDVAEYMRIVDLYGQACLGLSRLLKNGPGDEYERMKAYFRRQVDQAIRRVRQEWGLDRKEEPGLIAQGGSQLTTESS